MKSKIEQLGLQQRKKRNAALVGRLEAASAKIDRFGWGRMDRALKDKLCADWCKELQFFTVAEIDQGIADVFEAAKGNLRTINEHQVKAAIRKRHRAEIGALRHRKPKPVVKIVSEEEMAWRRKAAARILRKAGFGSNLGDGK